MQQRILFRGIHSEVVFARARCIHKFQFDVLANSRQIAPAPGLPWIGRRRTAAIFHRPIPRAAHRM